MSTYEGIRGWGVDYRDEWGKRHRFIVGTQAAAEAVDAQVRAQVLTARSQFKRFAAAAALTIPQAVEAWQGSRAVKPITRRTEAKRLAHFVREFALTRPEEVTPQRLAEFLAARREQCAEWTVYQTHRCLMAFFLWCAHQQIIARSPVGKLPRPPRGTRGFALSAEQQAEILAVAVQLRTRARLLLALDAGMSFVDTHMLQRGQINLDQRVITYRRSKTRVHVLVPLTERLHSTLVELLEGCTRPDAAPFESHAQQPKADLKRLTLKVPFHFSLHDLRHTFESRLASTGCRVRIVQALMGHSPRTPTEKYDHPTLDELREAIKAMERGVRLIAAPPQDTRAPGGDKP